MYNPPFKITNKMLNLVSKISENVEKINFQINQETKVHLRRNSKIKSIHSSLKIEANSLSLNQINDVINGKLVIGDRREIQEVKNAYEAYNKLSDINPYKINDLNEIHLIMTKHLIEQAGKFRNSEVGVFEGDRCIFMAPSHTNVSRLMNDLFKWLNKEKDNIHPLILSSIFHYEFVFIHPYADGNGRMARLWHTAILCKWKPIFEFIPIESEIEKYQNEYYKAISKCHVNGNSNVFIEFMLTQINMALENIINSNVVNNYLSEYELRLLNCMEFNTPYTLIKLMEMLNLKSKETFRKNYLHPLMEKGIVEMTIPDKPKSKNQRYIRNN
ncbi:MAG: Fic family protein [Bacillota bacterium]|jgi:Fic family protein|nr:Fic family protein [Bacillota bacterium]